MNFVNQLLVKAKIATLVLVENKFNQGLLNLSFNIVLLDCNSRVICFLLLQGKLDFFLHVSTLYSFYNYQYLNNYGLSFGKYFKCYYFSFLYLQKYTKQLSLQIHMLFLIVCHLTLVFPGAGKRRRVSVSFLHAYHHSGVFLPDSQFPTAVYGLERGFYSTIQPGE